MSSQVADKAFKEEVQGLHSEIQKVFGDTPPPVIKSKVQSDAYETQISPDRAVARRERKGLGGEADIDLYIGHIRTPDTDNCSLRSRFSDPSECFHYLVSIDHYGKGNAEATISKHDNAFDLVKPKTDKVRINKSRAEMLPEDLEKSERRAASKLRKKAIMLRPVDMLTLNCQVPIYDRKEALKVFRKFAREMQKRFKKFDYIMVMERHKKGDIHFHLAITRSYHWDTVRYIWRKANGTGVGNVHFSNNKRFSKNQTFQTAKRIAGYLKKYFTKDDASEFGENRYSFSKGIPVPRKERFYIPIVDYTFELVEELIKEVTGRKIHRIFDIDDNPVLRHWLSTF